MQALLAGDTLDTIAERVWGQSGDATVATEGSVPQDRHQQPNRIDPPWAARVGCVQGIAFFGIILVLSKCRYDKADC
jgi:hypothetical protein